MAGVKEKREAAMAAAVGALEQIAEARSVRDARMIAREALGLDRPSEPVTAETIADWVDARGGPQRVADLLGMERHTVRGWGLGKRSAPPMLLLALRAIDAGAKRRDLDAAALEAWMRRNAYDAAGLAADLGLARAETVKRWLGQTRQERSIPSWLSLSLDTLAADKDALAQRRQRRRQRQRAEAAA